MPLKLDSLTKLFAHELKDLYSAENQLLEVLPRLGERANDEDLKKAFQHHEKQTRNHVKRLEKVFADLGFEPGGHHCVGMEGLLKEARELLSESDIDPNVLDAALIAAAQRAEHYEMAGYGVARTMAEKLGHYDAADRLQDTLNEEAAADQKLSRLAERRINFKAAV